MVILWFIGSSCLAQSTQETWQTKSIKDLRTGKGHPYVCSFKIYPGDRVDWIQGDVAFSFPITSTEGNLPVNGTGLVTYNLIKEGKAGKVIIEREADGDTWLTLDLQEGNQLGAYYRFQISVP